MRIFRVLSHYPSSRRELVLPCELSLFAHAKTALCVLLVAAVVAVIVKVVAIAAIAHQIKARQK